MAKYEKALSSGGELLVQRVEANRQANLGELTFDVVVVGSGYGGAVAAARLSEIFRSKGDEQLSVCVLERGQEHLPGSFPERFADLPGHVRVNRFDTAELTGDAGGLFDLRIGEDVSVLVGNGLGGGSLINASVAEEPDAEVFRSWPNELRNPTELRKYFGIAARMLGVGPAVTKGLRKYREFAAWAEGLGVAAQPAKVAVTFRNGNDNGHGVEQRACINCGDCVTGCNHHAKNTLPMNYLARAKANGACLYTGVTVSHLSPIRNDEWAVHFNLTPRPGAPAWPREAGREPHRVLARHVILAAGALGSTEILMRSRSRGAIEVSDALGKHFSCNGDMISALYAQDCQVNAAAPEHVPSEQRKVGPTITGIARRPGPRDKRLVLEELAIPASLRRVFEEVVTTSALPYGLGGFDSSSVLGSQVDPAAVDPRAVDRTQAFAAIGEDSADGCLELIPGWDDNNRKVADGVVTVKWPSAGAAAIYAEQDKFMARPTTNGGTYLRSPLWQPLPQEFADELAGKTPNGKLFTVHPLGGCAMADNGRAGVVNHRGQLFRVGPRGEGLYSNLLVLDGSIVPTALGINPLLTITALAERAIDLYIRNDLTQKSWEAQSVPPTVPRAVVANSPVGRTLRRVGRALGCYALADLFVRAPSQQWPDRRVPTHLRFAERVHGDLDLGSIHETKLALHFQAVEDVSGFLRTRSRKLMVPDGRIEVIPRGRDEKHLRGARVTGSVVLLEPWHLSAFTRTFVALQAFLHRRGIADLLLKRRTERAENAKPPRHPADEPATAEDREAGRRLVRWTWLLALAAGVAAEIGCLLWPAWRLARRWSGGRVDAITRWLLKKYRFVAFVPLAYQIGEARRLRYRLTLEEDLVLANGILPKGTRIKGQKILRFTLDGNPWWQVFGLPVAIRRPWSVRVTKGTLNVDLAYFFRRYATQLQIAQQRDLPSAVVDVFSTVLLLLRMVAKIHFWSFRLPEYQKHDPKIVEHRTPADLPGLVREVYWLDREDKPSAGAKVPKLLLTRYGKEGARERGKPVVLFHGLGASGNQFATNKLKTNLVQHLAGKNRDVWVAELRHSIALESSQQQWSLDDVALNDVPRIVRTVCHVTRQPQLDVVAHCIGSAMFCTAALKGELHGMIDSAVLMQVGPLITLSEGTKIRAYLAAFLRRYMMESFVDFSVDERADWIDSLIDRVLASYPYPAEEARHHDLQPPWQSQLHLANCNRWAAIDGRMLVHENVHPDMLLALGEILGHANLKTWEQTIQYAYLERLTDAEACNSYVTEENIRAHFDFPVRFIHGKENDVFDVRTSRRSCELLKQTFGEAHACDVQEIKGYSHLDPLIGMNAHQDVYPLISKFLSAERTLKPFHRPAPREVRPPLIGPILGWTRKNDAGSWTARVWCRVDDTRSPCSYVLLVPRKNGHTLVDKIRPVSPHDSRIDTLAVADVELEGDEADYEIFVMSVHLPGRQPAQVAKAMVKAKAADGLIASTEVQLSPEERAKRLAEFEKALAPRSGKDCCTTDHGYDQPLSSAVLSRSVLKQNSGRDSLRFALGSCRYGASVLDRERADACFGRLRTLIESDTPEDTPAFLLLVGDQIYADQTAGVFDSGGRRERFYEAYREAWTAPNARAVLSRLPTYMMLDDHEIGDNWHPLDDPGGDEGRLRRHGLAAFQEYQLLHSPRHEGPLSAARLEQPAEGFRYKFRAGSPPFFPFFVFDTRTVRRRDGRIMSPEQMEDFKVWLRAQDPLRPKFVASPSVVVPYRASAAHSDAWDGYQESLSELFSSIWDARADNVVFLCGDAHLSVASRLSLTDRNAGGQRGLRAYCVVSSGFYAPFPFANSKRGDYLPANGSRPLQISDSVSMHYQAVEGSWLPEVDNFTMVDVQQIGEEWSISLRQYTAALGAPQVVQLTPTTPASFTAPAARRPADREPSTTDEAATQRWTG